MLRVLEMKFWLLMLKLVMHLVWKIIVLMFFVFLMGLCLKTIVVVRKVLFLF